MTVDQTAPCPSTAKHLFWIIHQLSGRKKEEKEGFHMSSVVYLWPRVSIHKNLLSWKYTNMIQELPLVAPVNYSSKLCHMLEGEELLVFVLNSFS